jgi:hypothetical protein
MNVEILQGLGPPCEGDYGGVKRTGRDEPTVVVIHTCIERIQGNFLSSYLYLKPAKTPCFSIKK